ncbi:hypothetical protein CURTO8I2_70161 [Curtobacterium sp. 8I-2]|nr:hypothetical protein CURTO8I2_70161 [Curtobacterium sp. 8I-2]
MVDVPDHPTRHGRTHNSRDRRVHPRFPHRALRHLRTPAARGVGDPSYTGTTPDPHHHQPARRPAGLRAEHVAPVADVAPFVVRRPARGT